MSVETRTENNASGIVIRKLLYDCPLYRGLKAEDTEIRVLVLGSGSYARKFVDAALEAGQLRLRSLVLTVMSDDPEAASTQYLEARPDMTRFVKVNGQHCGEQVYGSVDFCAFPGGRFSRQDTAENERLIEELAKSAWHYVFIALGDNRLNRRAANLLSRKQSCPVCYVDSGRKQLPAHPGENPVPVCTEVPITPEAIDPQLDQMAFNTHMVWNKQGNLDRVKALEEFRNSRDDYESSLAFALSVRYKLLSIGIALEQDGLDWEGLTVAKNLQDAADKFARQVLAVRDTDPEAGAKFNALVALEHRRWNIFKLVEGWTAPLDENGQLMLDECVRQGKAKLTGKRHACLVPGGETAPLKDEAYWADNRSKWENPNLDADLDMLDRLSLELHQKFRAAAKAVKAGNPIHGAQMNALREAVFGRGAEAEQAYRQYRFCLKNILNGVESYSLRYRSYADALLQAAEKLPTYDRVQQLVSELGQLFTPVIEANLYRDYKATDEDLLVQLPNIVTFRQIPALALAFQDGVLENGRNEAVFANVASASVLYPSKLCYVYCYTETSNFDILGRKLRAVLNYLNARKLHCEVAFAAACTLGEEMQQKLKDLLESVREQSAGTARLTEYQVFGCDFTLNAADVLLDWVKEQKAALYDGSAKLFDSDLENGMFLRRVLEEKIPYFEFNRSSKTFPIHVGCDFLRYVRDDAFLSVDDMFALMDAQVLEVGFPELAEDYEKLWKIYTGGYLPGEFAFTNGVQNWNNLSRVLAGYDQYRSILATFNETDNPKLMTLEFSLPPFTRPVVQELLQKLEEYEVIKSGWYLSTGFSGNVAVTLCTYAEYGFQMKHLFRRPQYLVPYYDVQVIPTLDGVRVAFSCLDVENVNLEYAPGKGKHLYMVLVQLEKNGYISSLVRDEATNLVSFVYASPRIRKLLLSGGEMLELHTYFSVLKTGYFDDVVWSYGFRWSEGEVSNELDLVLTKGFRTFIVECKAVQSLDLTYYHKLHSLAEHFGIGTTKILIGNTYKDFQRHNRTVNDMQRSRGSQMNILTISEEADIRNIGEVLVKLAQQ